jgi:predicted MPP superfamily phosphohydrolase
VHAADVDLLFFSGDLVSEGRDYIASALDVMCNPASKLGSIACMGDHDFWTAARKIPREMKKCGWNFLQNEHCLFSYKGYHILVTGVTNIYSRRIKKYELERLLANAPDANADLKILLAHQPRDFLVETAAEYGYHLLLAGHTHGGQIVPHLFGMPITPSQAETRFYRGRYRHKGLHVIITNGIGLTLAPVRYHAPAEITRIILVKGDENGL